MAKKRKSLKIPRSLAFQKQIGRCFYCQLPMWLDHPEAFAAQYNLTTAQARILKCTGEHLQAKCNGGKDTGANIVAACWQCNTRRHRSKKALTPDKYSKHVRSRITAGRWIPRELQKINYAVTLL